MSDDRSWIKLYRAIGDSPIFTHPGMLQIWIHFLIKANFSDSTWVIPGTTTEIQVPRGSLIVGREKLYSRLYPAPTASSPSSKTVWRWVQSLVKLGCVRVQNVSNRCSLITVVNYNSYQNSKPDQCPTDVQQMSRSCPTDVQQMSRSCPTDVQPMSTSKEFKNEIKEEGKNEECAPDEIPAGLGFETQYPSDFEEFSSTFDRAKRGGKWGVFQSEWRETLVSLVQCGRFQSEPAAAEFLIDRAKSYADSASTKEGFGVSMRNFLLRRVFDDAAEAWAPKRKANGASSALDAVLAKRGIK